MDVCSDVFQRLQIDKRATDANIKAIPIESRKVKVSSKTETPITTAVNGSKAPMTAVGVDPTSLTAFAMNTSERYAGTNPSMNPQPH